MLRNGPFGALARSLAPVTDAQKHAVRAGFFLAPARFVTIREIRMKLTAIDSKLRPRIDTRMALRRIPGNIEATVKRYKDTP